jgi:hypothetical protein
MILPAPATECSSCSRAFTTLDALQVVRENFGDRVEQLGDVTKLTDENIYKLCPIDLVIGDWGLTL